MKKHGWVLQSKNTKRFEKDDDLGSGSNYTLNITEAAVYSMRDAARTSPSKMDFEMVRKVSLDKDGKAIEIIKGR